MGGVAGDDQDEGLDAFGAGLESVGFELDFGIGVHADAVFEFEDFEGFGAETGGGEVFAGADGRFLDETGIEGGGEVKAVDDVFEFAASAGFDAGSGGEFEAQDGLEVVDGLRSGFGAVAMAFIHNHDEVFEFGEVAEVAFAEGFA